MVPTVPSAPALFIVLEGIDGSGTTTQLDRVVRHLASRGRPALATREPSVGPIGRLLRELLRGEHRHADGSPVDGRAMALLFASDRRDHLAREIEPALAAGTDVVSDRYLLSSLAYQAVEADRRWVRQLSEGVRQPDVTILLDVPVAVAAERRRRAGRSVERYEDDVILERVASVYRELARSEPRVEVVDGTLEPDGVTHAITEAVDRCFDAKGGHR